MKLFTRSPKDERISAQLGPIYKTGFFIMAFGILFDIYTRYNYLAQETVESPGPLSADSIEIATLLIACLAVVVMMTKRGIYSDSLRYTESRSFFEAGCIASSFGVAGLMSVAAVGGRLYNEVVLLGWNEVTWVGDIAMLIVLFTMFSVFILAVQYLVWHSYRTREDRLACAEDEDD